MKDKYDTDDFFERSPWPEVRKLDEEALADAYRLVRQMEYHEEQVERAQHSEDKEVRQRFRDAMRHLMKNVKSDEDIKAFTKSLDAAFYRLRKGGDEKGAAVIRTVKMMLEEVDPDMWTTIVDIWPVWKFEKKEDE